MLLRTGLVRLSLPSFSLALLHNLTKPITLNLRYFSQIKPVRSNPHLQTFQKTTYRIARNTTLFTTNNSLLPLLLPDSARYSLFPHRYCRKDTGNRRNLSLNPPFQRSFFPRLFQTQLFPIAQRWQTTSPRSSLQQI